jgi:hypothetical protein
MVEELLEQNGEDALLSILVLSSHLLSWSAYKLNEDGQAELGREFLELATSVEKMMLNRLDPANVERAAIVPFAPRDG